jgi:hypothetical protein
MDALGAEVRQEILDNLPPLIRVYACRQCNSVLGNRLFRTMKDRREVVKGYLKRKYRRLLNAPDWDEDEIEELGDGLRDFVRDRKKFKENIEARIAWKR